MKAGSGPKLEESRKKQLVTPRHSQYHCKEDIAIPMWELIDDDLEKLSKERSIIAKNFTLDEMNQKIWDVMYPIVDLVLDQKEFSFNIPSKSILFYHVVL